MNKTKQRLNKELFLLLLASSSVMAAPPSIARLQLSGSGVAPRLGSLAGDAMLPMNGSTDSFLFVDFMGGYASNATYLMSPGSGFRSVFHNQIFGAYLFGDYEQTRLGVNFWNISPGLEWITPHWDAHLNGYFPTQTKKIIGASQYANTLGDDSFVSFTSGTHNQYDHLMTPYAVIGNGSDIEIGYSVDKRGNALRSRLFVGSYYYQAPNKTLLNIPLKDIIGFTAGFSHALSENIKCTLFNSYDDVSSYNVGIRVTLTFGSESNLFSNDVHTRLLDTVERHVGIIDTGAGNYDQQYWQQDGIGLEYNNIYFISPDGTGDGTYGNPMSLTQTTLDTIHANAPNGSRLYLQGGANAVYTVNGTTATGGTGLNVYQGESFYGRSSDYRTLAPSSLQPQISVDGLNNYNGFITQGGDTIFSNLTIYSSTTGYGTGIISNNNLSVAESLTINNTTISQFTTAVYVNNSNTGTFTLNTYNSHFDNNSQSGSGAAAYGINLFNSGAGEFILNINRSTFNNNMTTGDSNQTAGLSVYNASSGTVITQLVDSTFNNNTATGTNSPLTAGFYVYNNGSGLVKISTLNSQFNSNFASYQAFGLEAINNNSGTMLVNTINSRFRGNNSDYSLNAGLAAGNYSNGKFILNSDHSVFIPGANEPSYGIYTYDAGASPITIWIR